MKLMWAAFSERPFLETYNTLEGHAKKAGGVAGVHFGGCLAGVQADDNHSLIKLIEQKRKSLYL